MGIFSFRKFAIFSLILFQLFINLKPLQMSINSSIVVQDSNLNCSKNKIMICSDFRIFWNVPMNVAADIMPNLYKLLCRK